jgi:hypothetical protein
VTRSPLARLIDGLREARQAWLALLRSADERFMWLRLLGMLFLGLCALAGFVIGALKV